MKLDLNLKHAGKKLKKKTAKSENQGKGRELFYVHRSTNNLQFNFVGLASFCMSIATTNFVHLFYSVNKGIMQKGQSVSVSVSELCACVFSNFFK